MDTTNWELCCLCQSDTDEQLQTHREEGLLSLDRVMNAFKEMNASPSCIAVTSNQLNDGSGIAATLRLHNVKYHKMCRTYCSSSRVKRLCPKEEQTEVSPKSSDLGRHLLHYL